MYFYIIYIVYAYLIIIAIMYQLPNRLSMHIGIVMMIYINLTCIMFSEI